VASERIGVYRCRTCGDVAKVTNPSWLDEGLNAWCDDCGHMRTWAQVAVLPLAEAEALKRLRDAVEDDALFQSCYYVEYDEDLYGTKRFNAVEYRCRLRAAMEGKP
jgi:hypothetical protein